MRDLRSEVTTTTPTTTPAPILENEEFPMFPIHSSEISWTLSEVFGIIGHLGSVAITEMADMSVGNMIMNDILDNVLRLPETLRLLMDYHDDRVLLIIVDRSYHVNRETTMAVLAEFPEAVHRLITFWEGYNGVHSSKYLFPLLHVRVSDPEFLSTLLVRVIKNVAKFRELVNEIIFLGHTKRLPELTEAAVEALMDFWGNRQLHDPLSILSSIALSRVTDEYCDKLRDTQSLASEATRILIWNCPHLGAFPERAALLRDISTGVNRLVVVRHSILEGAIEWFAAADSARIRSGMIKVQFVEEGGMDGGGLGREWYHLVARGIINGMLIETEPNSGRFSPNTVGENRMEFVGKFIAKAIRDGQRLARMRFAHIVYRYILEGLDGVELDLEMYGHLSSEHANTLRWLLDNDPSSEGWEAATRDLSFSVDLIQLGEHSVHELIDGGSAIPVNQENKGDYVQRVIEYKMRQSIRPQLESFLVGFHSVLPREDLQGRFTPEELETVIAGGSGIDLADLKEYTQYEGYMATSQQIVWFWEVLQEFDQDQLGLLVQFTSGIPIGPAGGFVSFPLRITRVGLHQNPDRNPLPSAHTCSNQLDLPAYLSKEELEEKLIRSLALASEGFGFA
jgi:hypothetical protein